MNRFHDEKNDAARNQPHRSDKAHDRKIARSAKSCDVEHYLERHNGARIGEKRLAVLAEKTRSSVPKSDAHCDYTDGFKDDDAHGAV